MSTLLIIDDDVAVLEFFRSVLVGSQLTLLTATSAAEGLDLFRQHRPDVVLLDVELPDLSGLETFRRLRQINAKVPVLFVTGSSTTATAIEAMALGAYDYLLKPIGAESLCQVVAQALEVSRLMRVPAVVTELAAADTNADPLVGRCSAMHAVYKSIGRVAAQDVTTLIRGESGTGKELVARAIYHYSRRSAGLFLTINCAAIPDALLESELFGHEKGAFNGASQQRIGKFEQCSGGTLFLDEVGDMAPLTQAKLLRVLQEQQFERVGGNDTIRTNVRIIAATNRNLEELVTSGRFREDLYYRLNVYMIRLPALRERGEDVALLATTFLRRFSPELRKDVTGFTPEALNCLRRHPWPGNVRELQSALKHALLQATGPVIVSEFLPESICRASDRSLDAGVSNQGSADGPVSSALDQLVEERLQAGSTNLYAEWLAMAERRLLTRVLRHTEGKLSPAAMLLGIHRATLRTRIAALGVVPPDMESTGETSEVVPVALAKD